MSCKESDKGALASGYAFLQFVLILVSSKKKRKTTVLLDRTFRGHPVLACNNDPMKLISFPLMKLHRSV